MKSNGIEISGIIRRMDDLGRIVIPKEVRRTLGMEIGDAVKILVVENQMILTKYKDYLDKER